MGAVVVVGVSSVKRSVTAHLHRQSWPEKNRAVAAHVRVGLLPLGYWKTPEYCTRGPLPKTLSFSLATPTCLACLLHANATQQDSV